MRSVHRPPSHPFDISQRARELMRKAYRLRRRGDDRRAVLTMREACGLDHENAAHWMIYGAYLVRLGRTPDAERAMKQALYLHERQGSKPKARVVKAQLAHLRHEGYPRLAG